MLARRSVQQLLDESQAYLKPEQHASFVHRLNLLTTESLHAQWELIVLAGLASIGNVEHEPAMQGTAKLDVRLRAADLHFVADVRAVSDESFHSENPIHDLSNEFGRIVSELRAEGIIGTLDFRVNGIPAAVWRRRYKTTLIVPRIHEFRRYIFDARFSKFLATIRAAPTQVHHHRVDNEMASLSVVFNPGGNGMRSYVYPPFEFAHDAIRNVVHENLERKARQIKRAGPRAAGELAGILLCDAGCTMLRHHVVGAVPLERILTQFLSGTNTIDFVGVIDVRPVYDTWTDQWHSKLQFETRVWCVRQPDVGERLSERFNDAFASLPPPISMPSTAQNLLVRRRRSSDSKLYANYSRQNIMTETSVTISLRAVVDYLTGRIDRQQFESIVQPDFLDFVRRRLDSGGGVSDVSIDRHLHTDDDGLVLVLTGHDAANGPFRKNPGRST